MSKAQEQADIQRAEAKRLLNSAFGWGENITSEAVDRAIDCIISAAILETVLVANAGIQSSMANRPTLVYEADGTMRVATYEQIDEASQQGDLP